MKLLAKPLIIAVAEVFQSADIQHHAQFGDVDIHQLQGGKVSLSPPPFIFISNVLERWILHGKNDGNWKKKLNFMIGAFPSFCFVFKIPSSI